VGSHDRSLLWLSILPKLLLTATLLRCVLITFMAVSDYIITDHNPGDDVFRFDLRLNAKDGGSHCFCLEGLACDPSWKLWDRSQKIRTCVDERETSASENKQFLAKLFLQPMTKWDGARFLRLAADPWIRRPCRECGNQFLDSEQAHAFFPLFPLMIRTLAVSLVQIMPLCLLPPTFEAVLVFSSLLINYFSFVIALICLVTLSLCHTRESTKERSDELFIIGRIATIFCLNPATIFFCVSYSESVFAMYTLGGYCLYSLGYSYLAVLAWMAASYTRSNGCLVSVWLIIQGIASGLQKDRPVLNRLIITLWHLTMAALVTIPLFIHDENGYGLNCRGDIINADCGNRVGSFYGYVQRKHWNVGFLRYFQLRQIPNFLLATPILIYSGSGAWNWVRISWKKQPEALKAKCGVSRLFNWAIWALRQSKVEDEIVYSSPDTLYRPTMLAHYAILAIAALLGFTMAHVQISTRLICSTCPAIYWQLARPYVSMKQNATKTGHTTATLWDPIATAFLGIYIVVGTIIHVNFLPWT